MKKEQASINICLPKSVMEDLQEEAEDFSLGLDMFVSLVVSSAFRGRLAKVDDGSMYECVKEEWKRWKEEGLCE